MGSSNRNEFFIPEENVFAFLNLVDDDTIRHVRRRIESAEKHMRFIPGYDRADYNNAAEDYGKAVEIILRAVYEKVVPKDKQKDNASTNIMIQNPDLQDVLESDWFDAALTKKISLGYRDRKTGEEKTVYETFYHVKTFRNDETHDKTSLHGDEIYAGNEAPVEYSYKSRRYIFIITHELFRYLYPDLEMPGLGSYSDFINNNIAFNNYRNRQESDMYDEGGKSTEWEHGDSESQTTDEKSELETADDDKLIDDKPEADDINDENKAGMCEESGCEKGQTDSGSETEESSKADQGVRHKNSRRVLVVVLGLLLCLAITIANDYIGKEFHSDSDIQINDIIISELPGNGWGDSEGGRSGYSKKEINEGILDETITFNSIYDGIIGDEKNFVAAKLADNSESKWSSDTVTVKDGEIYTVCMYVSNDNPGGMTAIAEDVRAVFSLPTHVSNEHWIVGYLDSSNATPDRYWDTVSMVSDEPIYLEYIEDSARFFNSEMGVIQLGNDVITSGVPLGFDRFDGKIPGGDSFAGLITIDVKVHESVTAAITVKARLKDTKEWKSVIYANKGDEVEFLISFENYLSETVNDVMIRDMLPDNVAYISDSTYLSNSNHENGIKMKENTITTDGVNIGDYTQGSSAYVKFSGKIVDDSLASGSNQYVNSASVTIWKTKEEYDCYKVDVSLFVYKH